MRETLCNIMKNRFAYLILVLILMFSCKNETSKKTELTPEKIKLKTDSLKIEMKVKNSRPCDFRTLKEIDSLLQRNEKLNEQNYLKFIVNMRTDCANNVEYSQWNNELIFKMLELNPKLFVAFLSRLSRKTNSTNTKDFVVDELKKPINDGIEIDKLISLLKNAKTENEEIKAELIKSLNLAEQNAE